MCRFIGVLCCAKLLLLCDAQSLLKERNLELPESMVVSPAGAQRPCSLRLPCMLYLSIALPFHPNQQLLRLMV